MKIFRYPGPDSRDEIIKRPVMDYKSIDSAVIPILEAVKYDGDKALRLYTKKFDGVDIDDIALTESELMSSVNKIDPELKTAIQMASDNIEVFHRSQQTSVKRIKINNGIECWQKPVPVEKVGFYIPGGSAPLFSTVLMLAIPARIAGCSEIVLCTPPDKNGNVHPAILYSAFMTGVRNVFRIGGAQAIAAMAFGTETIPKVDKIFGPGNQYVTAAKQLVMRNSVAIDMPAGPSEVAVIADETANPAFVASDLLSQAEHGADSQVLLFTNNENTLQQVINEVEIQLEQLPRKDIARLSLNHCRLVLLNSMEEIICLVNDYAPEHLIISIKNDEEIAERILNAGSVFLGNYTPESAGDYISGTNHTLPTNGYAKTYSGVNLDSFIKKITFQKISKEGLTSIAPAIMKMAETERMTAHKRAVSIRLKK